jgi:hypothetical protein
MTTTTEINAFRVLGITDEVTECDCCGRQNLKATVVLRFDNDTENRHYGRTCAARYARVEVKVIDKGVKAAEAERRAAEEAARRAAADASFAAWKAFLDAEAGPGDTLEQITRLGGFVAARAAYKASA